MKGAAIMVHYHTPSLVAPALEALRLDAEQAELDIEWILVDNGSRPQDREAWRSLPLRVLEPGRNLGYAGGLLYGVEATDANWLIVLNPDVFVRPGCLAGLVRELSCGADAAGPRFLWDTDAHWHLPPTEKRRKFDEVLAVGARLGGVWAWLARQRWRRHAWTHWTAQEAVESFELSGALLALSRDAWNRIGPFDADYRLYFEETDWLERLRSQGGCARFVPDAEAIHLHARSTIDEPRSEGWFLASARRFRRRHYGERFSRWLERIDRQVARHRQAHPPRCAAVDGRAVSPRVHLPYTGIAWVEASMALTGFPAAGLAFGSEPSSFPAIEQSLPGGRPEDRAGCVLRAVAPTGRELGTWKIAG